ESVEAERFFPAPKPVNGFKMQRVTYFESNRRKKPRPNQNANDNGSNAADAPVLQAGEATPWGILAVHAGDAWAQSGAGKGARVLVLDTGIDAEHPAIAENFEKGRNFTEDASGQVDQGAYQDEEGHGTHCAGTILGAYNETTGFTGVAPKAKLLMGRVCGAEGCSSIAIVEGINWGIQEKVDVISMSLGGPAGAPAERAAVTKADNANIVVIAASGNSADQPTYSPNRNDPKCKQGGNPFQPADCGVSFPAAFPTVVAVGAINSDLVKTNFSQWGPELDVVGPGAAVISSVPRGSGRLSDVVLTINGTAQKVNSSAFGGTELFAHAVVNSLVAVPGVGKPEDFAGVDVEGKFALIKRGEIDEVKAVMTKSRELGMQTF
ncbi:MAG: S8 family serine peptidase, partial [Bdellovibrionaceae bacterium]|nr:S8 family serine peptidase [Pseudobdellovibrionaceae bacterium]